MAGGYPIGLEICNGTDIGSNLSTMGVAITAGQNTPGSWTQIVSSTASDTCWMEISIYPPVTSSTSTAIDIGVGAAASEVTIINKLMCESTNANNNVACYCFPVSIPAGTRISARASNSATTDITWVNIRLYDGAYTQMEGAAGVDAIGFVSGTTTGTTLTSGSTGAKGSYAQLVASTSRDYMGFCGSLDNGTAIGWGLLDIAIGAAASEIVIKPNLGICTSTSNIDVPSPFPIQWTPIPAGTRLSARWDSAAGSAIAVNLTLYGIYR